MKLTAYGGISEIGGNKLLLEDGGTRIFLDFGVSFGAEGKYFDGRISPRQLNGLGDYFEFDLVPKLGGLYAEKLIKQTEVKYKPPEYQGVLVSHAHADHAGYLHFLDETIPIYCGETSKTILCALKETGAIQLEATTLKGFRTGQKLSVDNIEVEPIHVDHSIPGAYGLLIHTSEGTLVYTGDLRFHGPAGRMTEEFIAKAADLHPIAMACEGTRVGESESHKLNSEQEVKESSNKVVASTSKLVASSFYGRDIDRINTFYSVALANNRKFVVPMRMALLLSRLKGDIHLPVPDVLGDENILVYKKRKKSGAYDPKDYFKWERPFLQKAIDHRYIHDNQSKLLITIDPWEFAELIDIKPQPGGQYIYSMSEPHSEIETVDEDIQKNWLNHFGMKYNAIHASGHAPPKDIGRIVETVKPKTLIPIHTEHPNEFTSLLRTKSSRILILEKSKTYELR